MFRFMENKTNNPKLTQTKRVKELGCSDLTLKRYGSDIKNRYPVNRSEKERKNNSKNSHGPFFYPTLVNTGSFQTIDAYD